MNLTEASRNAAFGIVNEKTFPGGKKPGKGKITLSDVPFVNIRAAKPELKKFKIKVGHVYNGPHDDGADLTGTKKDLSVLFLFVSSSKLLNLAMMSGILFSSKV